MGYDSDPITVTKNRPDSLTTVIVDVLSNAQYKLFALMFVMFLFISSDSFINRILSTFSGTVDYKTVTSWGAILQGLFLVLACVIVDILIRQKII